MKVVINFSPDDFKQVFYKQIKALELKVSWESISGYEMYKTKYITRKQYLLIDSIASLWWKQITWTLVYV